MAELTAAAADDSEDGRRDQRRRATLAILSPLAGVAAFAYSRSSPADPVTVLRGMEGRSPTLQAALESGRPTVVEFYAQWCKDCKAMATSVDRLERRFDEKVNFVVLDAEKDENAKLVGLFRVDAIPHFAFISPERKLLTTLTGSRVLASLAFDVTFCAHVMQRLAFGSASLTIRVASFLPRDLARHSRCTHQGTCPRKRCPSRSKRSQAVRPCLIAVSCPTRHCSLGSPSSPHCKLIT